MKTEFVDVNETRKNVRVEIPQDVVAAEIDRVARDYSRRAKIPGFRPGKAPARVIKQRFKDQILHDVAHDLIPRAVDDALRERGVEAVDTPDVRDVTLEEGQPLTFTASFDTVPSFDPGELSTIALNRPRVDIAEEAVDGALQRLRERSARFEPIEGRGLDHGDTAVVDLERRDASGKPDSHHDVPIELGAKANPPGFEKQLPTRLPFDAPDSLVEREVDRRVEEFAHRLMDQQIDPRQAGIDWNAFRESQHEVARESVAAALVLQEVTRRERIDVTGDEVDREVERYAERTGRTTAAVRAALEKEGGLSRVAAGLRREKSIDFVMSRATIAGNS